MINVYQRGTSVKFTAIFKDWEDNIIDPSPIKFIVYDARYDKLEDIDITVSNKESLGTYSIEYAFNNEGDHIIEWYCQIDGTPSLKRERVRVNFV